MSTLGRLVVSLEANIARFTSDMERASQVTERAANKISGAVDFAGKALGALGVALSVVLHVSELNRAVDSLAELDDMAQKTGASVEVLSQLSKVAAFTNTDLGAMDGVVTKLAKNLAAVDEEGNKTAKALSAIGISSQDIKDQDPAQVFIQITRKLQDYEDGANKVALVTDLMGKSAADLLPYMNDVAESVDDFVGDTAEAAAAAAAYQDELGRMKVKYDEIAGSLVIALLPATSDFVSILSEVVRGANEVTASDVDTWADDVAVGLARVVDVAALIPRMLKTVSSSFKAVAADIVFVGSASIQLRPDSIAKALAKGQNPLDGLRAAFAERNAIVDEANKNLDDLINIPANRYEQAILGRIAGRSDAATMAGIDGLAGMVPAATPSRTALAYSGSDDKDKKGKKEKEVWSGEAAAERMVKFALDETLALGTTVEMTDSLIAADAKRFEQKMRQAERITAGAENIRLSLMSDAEAEQTFHDDRIAQLQAFSALKLENEMTANALIEAETMRHVQAKADMERGHQLQVLAMAGNSADQLYSLMEQAGLEQTALGKALFVANKAIAVAEIIMNTELAAAKALAMGPIVGPPLAAVVRGLGYASAGIVIGTTIASAEGGYDIPAGTNPVTQLHEKEMVLPKAQAEVIRGLAANGGVRGSGVSITYSPNFNIDARSDREQARKDMEIVARQANADLVDRLQRAGRI